VPSKRPKRNIGQVALRAPDGPFVTAGSGTGFSKFFSASPFPPKWRVKLPFASQYNLPTVGSAYFGTEQIMRLNSLYDPDFTGAGNYPYGFSAMSAMYGSYRVRSVLIDLVWSNPSIDGSFVGAMVQPSGSTFTMAGQYPLAVDIQPGGDVRVLNITGSQTVRVTKRFTIAELDGISPTQWAADPNYSAQVGANPANCPLLRLAIQATSSSHVTVQVRLEFECEFYNRTILTA